MNVRTLPVLPLLILPLAVALLQSHGIPFWQAQVGWWPGLGWSLLLELIALWLWFRPGCRWWRPLAWVATLLLLAGPLYRVSDPLVRDLAALRGDNATPAARIGLLQSQIAEAEKSLDRYQRLSLSGRYGWQQKIDEAETQLSQVRGRLEEDLAAQDERRRSASLNWRRVLLVGAQLVSLVLFQAAAVLAIRALGAHHSAARTTPLQVRPPSDSNGHGPTEQLVVVLQQAVQRLLKSGRSYAQIAEETGIGKGHLSLLINHFDRAKRGDRILGEAALLAVQGKLMSNGSSATE